MLKEKEQTKLPRYRRFINSLTHESSKIIVVSVCIIRGMRFIDGSAKPQLLITTNIPETWRWHYRNKIKSNKELATEKNIIK